MKRKIENNITKKLEEISFLILTEIIIENYTINIFEQIIKLVKIILLLHKIIIIYRRIICWRIIIYRRIICWRIIIY